MATSTLRIGALAFAAAGFASAALAFEGRYVSEENEYSQELTIKKLPGGRYKAKASVAMQGCVGQFEGEGEIKDKDLVVTNVYNNETCSLIIGRTKKGLDVSEDHCLPWHGVRCDFNGDYRKKR